jgi:hypothetical protein
MMPTKFGFAPMGFFKETCSWALGCGLYELKSFQLSIASCKHLQPDIAGVRYLERRKLSTWHIDISILVYRLCAIITYIICCLPTPKCRHTQSYHLLPLSHWALTSSTNHGCLADQTSKVVFVISFPNFIETEHKKQRESVKENESTNVLVALKPSKWERRLMMSHF